MSMIRFSFSSNIPPYILELLLVDFQAFPATLPEINDDQLVECFYTVFTKKNVQINFR